MNTVRKPDVLIAERKCTRGLRSTVEASAWLMLAVATVIYGNGRHDLITVVLHHPSVWREAYFFGVAGMAVNMAVFLYLAFWDTSLRQSTVPASDIGQKSPLAIHIGTAAGITAFAGFAAAIWPVWSWLTPVILFVLFMGFIMGVQLLPTRQAYSRHSLGQQAKHE